MAVSSLSAAFILPLSLSNSSSPSLSSKPKFLSSCFLSGNTLRLTSPKPLHSPTVVYAAPEVLDSPDPPQETREDESEPTTFQVSDFSFFVFPFLHFHFHVHILCMNFPIAWLIAFLKCINSVYMLLYAKQLSLNLHNLSFMETKMKRDNENCGNVLLVFFFFAVLTSCL